MAQWVVTVAGIAILSILCDVVLPEGQTRKYIKTVIGIVVTIVMIQPLVGIVGNLHDTEGAISSDRPQVQIQQSYLDATEDKQLKNRLSLACSVLEANNVDVNVVGFDKSDKCIILQSNLQYSFESKSKIDKVFETYFNDYDVVINWK